MGGDSFATRAKSNEIRADGFKDSSAGTYSPKEPRATRSYSQRVAPSIRNPSLRGAAHDSRGRGKLAARVSRLRETERLAEENRRYDGYDDNLEGEAEEGEEGEEEEEEQGDMEY